jgi:serine protease Do
MAATETTAQRSPAALLALWLALWLPSGQTLAATKSPADLTELARSTTFEVVLPKIEPESIRYEKPLPLELLSFTERNDKFWSIGTAFAIAPDTYVSAAHVLLSGIGGPMGKPHLRDTAGNTYQIDQVLRFSLHEDFIVFRAKGTPTRTPLTPNREPATGSTVYAVGNALGEGVVVRDGLLTSMTPEDQDGRWKWLRFSAAASPGNSGGPLLDTEGRVAGVVVAKSPGENLNYALPIARVLDSSTSNATIDVRSSFALPILRQQLVTSYKQDFALPASWEDFSRALIAANNRQYEINQRQLLEQQDAQLLPRGEAARLLATLDRSTEIGLMQQQQDDTWGLTAPEGEEETKLTDGGSLWIGSFPGTASFRLKRPALAADAALYRNPTAFMDTLLKGLRIPRVVGSQAIRITSMGPPQREELHKDRFGRTWQLRVWALGYSDLNVIALALPTPEGYSGLLRLTAASSLQEATSGMKLVADHLHVSYQGSAGQWRSFLAERELCPPMLRGMELGKDKDFSLRLRDLDATVPAALLKLDDESIVTVYPGYRSDGRQLRADAAGVTLTGRDDDSSWVGIWAQSKPGSGAGTELEKRWKKMSGKQGDFTGQPQHSSDFKEFWTTSAHGNADSGLLYEVTLSWQEKSLIPRQVSERRDRVLSGLKIAAPGAR